MGTVVVARVVGAVVGTDVLGTVLGAGVDDVVDTMAVGGPDGSDVESPEEQAKLTMHVPSTAAVPQRRCVWPERVPERFSRDAPSTWVFYHPEA